MWNSSATTTMDALKISPSRIAAASLISVSLATAVTYLLTRVSQPATRQIISSPRETLLPGLSATQQASLGYPPNLLPGPRDVRTPYGTMRVYEWGPEAGRKVVLVHGDATPAPLFLPVATVLVNRGCRVLLIDLWGRGYSDTPADCQHDSRLHSLQILFAVTSSPLAWTGHASGGFSLVGFSMGGSVSMDFLAHFPLLVTSLVLLGPGGLIKRLPSDYTRTWYWHPSLVPKGYMRRLIGNLLGVNLSSKHRPKASEDQEQTRVADPASLLQFQFDHHHGHLHSFLSLLQYAPFQGQEEVWRRACQVIRGEDQSAKESKLSNGKILVICGAQDDVVLADHVESDLLRLLGADRAHFDFTTVPGNHGFVYTQGEAVGERIAEFWSLSK